MAPRDTIDIAGYPLGFCAVQGNRRPALLGSGTGRDVFRVDARQMSTHQKEAVVREGGDGNAWRLTSDEGKHLKGTDLAPFPLGFFNAGMHGDLLGRMAAMAHDRAIAIEDVRLELDNAYYLTGSFFRGDGQGFAEPSAVRVAMRSAASADRIVRLVTDAVAASPAFAALRTPLTNSFAIYVNGRRRDVATMTPSGSADAPDPFTTYSQPPAPLAGAAGDIIRMTGATETGAVEPAQAGTRSRITRSVRGVSHLVDEGGVTETETWLALPGMSHFSLVSDERPDGRTAPSGLSLLSAGIAFCYMTQISRYIEHMKFAIDGVRIVQYCPYGVKETPDGLQGVVEPVDTHLFLNGREDDETFETLMRIAARTCYLHATLGDSVDWSLTVDLNGERVL